ncbi:hypothetical protein Emag_004831 [Eimeria magna]
MQSSETLPEQQLSGPQSLPDLLIYGFRQFKEAFLDGNPIAVAAVGVVSFLLVTVAARCTYSFRPSSSSTKVGSCSRSHFKKQQLNGGDVSHEGMLVWLFYFREASGEKLAEVAVQHHRRQRPLQVP